MSKSVGRFNETMHALKY